MGYPMKIQIYIRGGCISEVRATSPDVEVELIDCDDMSLDDVDSQSPLHYKIDFDPA